MHRTPLPKISILLIIYANLLLPCVFGQAKPAGEVDVTKCWSYPLGNAAGEKLALDGSRVFLGLGGAKVEALSLDGKKMWATELGGDIRSNILPLESGLFLVTSAVSTEAGKPGESILRSLSKETGITNWTLKLPDAEKHFLGGFNGAVIAVSKSGVVQSIDAKTGTLKWKRELADGFVTEPVLNSGKLIVATNARQVFAVSLMSGEINSMRKLPFAVTAIGQTSGGQLVAGDERGNVISFINGSDKAVWKFRSGGEISKIIAADGHLLVTSHDNFVYFLGMSNGGRAWKKRLTGRMSHIANVLERYAMISSFEEHGAVLTDLANGKVAGQIVFAGEENLVYAPLASSGLIFVLTNQAVTAYSLNGCSAKKEGGNGQTAH